MRSSAAIAFPVAETVYVTEPVRTGVSVSVAAAEPSAPSDAMPKATRPAALTASTEFNIKVLRFTGWSLRSRRPWPPFGERGADVVGGLERVAAAVDRHRRPDRAGARDRHAVIGHARPIGVERSRVDPTGTTAGAGAAEDGALGQEVAAGLARGFELAAVDRGRRCFSRTAPPLESAPGRDARLPAASCSRRTSACPRGRHRRRVAVPSGLDAAAVEPPPPRAARRTIESAANGTTHPLACARSRRAESQPGLGIT